jgi:acetyltransferase-like isoleucine patch superfamily enzyme
MNRISTNSLFYDSPYTELTQLDCTIEDDVWIGVDSIIRRGVKIGIGAVVGANSFVNKDVPPFAIVAGNPARIIGSRFNDAKQKKILQSKWWLSSFKEAQDTIKDLERHVDTSK